MTLGLGWKPPVVLWGRILIGDWGTKSSSSWIALTFLQTNLTYFSIYSCVVSVLVCICTRTVHCYSSVTIEAYCIRVCLSVSECASLCVRKTLWTPYLKIRLREFHPILATDVFGFTDVLIRFWGQRSRSQQAVIQKTRWIQYLCNCWRYFHCT